MPALTADLPQERRNGDGAARVASLRQIIARLKVQLDDPRTPPYSIAPLSNQLRLAEKELGRLTAPPVDLGLPVDPEQVGVADLFGYRLRHRRRWPSRLREQPANAYVRAERALFESWAAAGFELLDRDGFAAGGTGTEAWLVACRVELRRCLDAFGSDDP